MKKLTFMAIAMGLLAFTACSEKKAAPAAAPATEEVEITDSAFQKAAAGDYKSADGKRIITINSDFSVKATNLDKDYYKWHFQVKPQGSAANIELASKGLENDVFASATLDINEGTLIVKNETFRKASK